MCQGRRGFVPIGPPEAVRKSTRVARQMILLEAMRDVTSQPGGSGTFPLIRHHAERIGVVEAGGVEPPSEKPCHQKTTCLARSLRLPPMAVCGFAGARSEGARNASG